MLGVAAGAIISKRAIELAMHNENSILIIYLFWWCHFKDKKILRISFFISRKSDERLLRYANFSARVCSEIFYYKISYLFSAVFVVHIRKNVLFSLDLIFIHIKPIKPYIFETVIVCRKKIC